MKKLLLVAGLGLAGYLAVKKLRNKNNEEVEEMENEEVVEEMAIDVEVMDTEDIEIVDEEEIKLVERIKGFAKTPIKLIVKMAGLLCGLLLKINKKLDHNVHRDSEYYKNEYVYKEGTVYRIIDGLDMTRLYTRRLVMIFNRCLMLVLTVISTMLNRLL